MIKYVLLVLSAFFLSGCVVKNSDSDLQKVIKHSINAPLYAVFATGAVGTAAGGAVGYGVSKTIDSVIGVELYLGEQYLGKMEQKELDTNTSLAMFYNNDFFGLYKDASNVNYLYIKQTKDVIHNVKFPHKRWSIAALEKKPTLYISKIQLDKTGLDEEYVLSKMTKDKFGNPIALGTNTFLSIKQRRSGLLLHKYTYLYLIEGGAHESGIINEDKNLPYGLSNQLQYYNL